MEDPAIQFEKAATLAMILLKEQEVVYEVDLRSALMQLEVNIRTLAFQFQRDKQPMGVELVWDLEQLSMQKQIKRLLRQAYKSSLYKLVKNFSDTHVIAKELLKVLSLPVAWPQSVLNQLLSKRLDIEFELRELIETGQNDIINYFKKVGLQKCSMIELGNGIHDLVNGWFDVALKRLLDGRMAYFRTILRLIGEGDRRIYFLYTGLTDGLTRPFCAIRNGRVFDLGEVRAWDKMVWIGQRVGYSVLERCGGHNCRHLLLPVLSEEMPKERFYSRLVKGVGLVGRSAKEVNLVGQSVQSVNLVGRSTKPVTVAAMKHYWCSDTVIGQWHDAAFGHALEYLRRAVGWSGVPTGGIRNTPGEQLMMFVLKNKVAWIEMGPIQYHTRLLRLEKLVWRHEFGHYMDYLLNSLNNIPLSFKDLILKRALLQDSQVIVMRAGLVGSKDYRMRIITKTNQVLYALMKQNSSIQASERQDWFDGEFRKFGLTLQQVEKALRIDSVYTGFELEQNRLILLLTALIRRDAFLFGEHVLEWGRKSHQQLGMSLIIGDYFGSITRNRVGRGHRDGYYQDVASRQGSETFANGIVLLGDGNLFWTRLLQILTPRFTSRMIEILKEARNFTN